MPNAQTYRSRLPVDKQTLGAAIGGAAAGMRGDRYRPGVRGGAAAAQDSGYADVSAQLAEKTRISRRGKRSPPSQSQAAQPPRRAGAPLGEQSPRAKRIFQRQPRKAFAIKIQSLCRDFDIRKLFCVPCGGA
ncbi:MAG: hypothetical protein ACLT14_00760 [Butyricicoccaceae bacterium]